MNLLGKKKGGDDDGEGRESQEIQVALLDEELLRIAKIIGMMLIAAGALWALTLIWPVVRMVVSTTMPFAVALVFAYIFNPIVNIFQKKMRLPRLGAVVVLYIIFFAIIVAFFAIMLPILIIQSRDAYSDISSFVSEQIAQDPKLEELRVALMAWLEANFQGVVQSEGVRQAATSAAGSGLRAVSGVIEFLYNAAMSVFGLIAALTFVFLVNIYLLLDFAKLPRVMEILVPKGHREKTFDVLGKLDVAVGGFIRGSLIVASIVGVLQGAGMYILGVSYISGLQNYALLIGLIAGFGALVPYLGTIAGGTPAILYVLLTDSFDDIQTRVICLGLVLLLIGLIQTIEGLLLQPKIVGEAAQLHPIAVIFALAMGANFGILGMILAVPVAAAVRVVLKEYFWDDRVNIYEKSKKALGADDPEAASP